MYLKVKLIKNVKSFPLFNRKIKIMTAVVEGMRGESSALPAHGAGRQFQFTAAVQVYTQIYLYLVSFPLFPSIFPRYNLPDRAALR